MKKVIKHTVEIIDAYHSLNYLQNFIQNPAVKINSICKGNYWVSLMWISTLTGQLMIIYSAFVKYARKNGNTIMRASALYRLQENL